MDERIENLVNEVTTGLKDDPELRLDVKAELTAHLEDTARACQSDETTEEESVEQAVKAFGSPVEIAGQLLEANKGRMKLRALARLFIRGLLVPAAVVIALLIGYRGLVEARGVIARAGGFTGGDTRTLPELPQVPYFPTFDKQFYPLMTKNPIFDHDHFYDYWKAHPEKTAVFAAHTAQSFRGAESVDVAEQYVAIGERIDPENALYRMALAYVWRSGAAYATSIKPGSFIKPGQESIRTMRLEIKDRTRLDRSMQEFLRATTYSTCTSHQRAFVREQLTLLSPAPRMGEQLLGMEVQFSLLMPEYARMGEFARILPLYAQLLLAEGKREEALRYLAAWKPFTLQITRGSESLIGMLVSVGVAKIAGNGVADVYDQMGLHDRAQQTRAEVAAFIAPVERWRANLQRNTQIDQGILTSLVQPFYISVVRPGELLILRHLDETLVEEWGSNVLMLIIALALVLVGILALDWHVRLRLHGQSTLLLVPTLPAILRIVGWGMMLPLVIYAVYTRWSGLAGREHSLGELGWRFVVELSVLALILFLLPLLLAARLIAHRCHALGVPVPPIWGAWRERFSACAHQIASFLLVVNLIVVCVTPLHNNYYSICTDLYIGYYSFWGILYLISVAAIVVLVVKIIRAFRNPSPLNRYALYYGTLTRSLAPVFVMMLIVLGGLVYPLLTVEEAQHIRRDTLLFSHSNQANIFLPVETRLVEQLQREMLQAIALGKADTAK
ncbi:MAG: permease prefix domain 1-containing protein [Armatimonadota bacterium]